MAHTLAAKMMPGQRRKCYEADSTNLVFSPSDFEARVVMSLRGLK